MVQDNDGYYFDLFVCKICETSSWWAAGALLLSIASHHALVDVHHMSWAAARGPVEVSRVEVHGHAWSTMHVQ